MTEARTGGMSGKLFLLLVALGASALGLAMYGFRTAWRADSRRSECRARLMTLATAAQEYHAKYHAWPSSTGPEFWADVVRGADPMVHRKVDLFHCPVTGKPYRGPSATPDDRSPACWMGCCEPGVHGDDIFALTSAWKFIEAKKDDPLYGTTK